MKASFSGKMQLTATTKGGLAQYIYGQCFEEISVNIFLMRKYAQKNVLDPDLFMCYY